MVELLLTHAAARSEAPRLPITAKLTQAAFSLFVEGGDAGVSKQRGRKEERRDRETQNVDVIQSKVNRRPFVA